MDRVGEHSSLTINRRADLDGLRGLAIGLVLVEHARLMPMFLGRAGVTVFFVLSGFIITTLLLREERVDLRRFYLRRGLRLLPALFVLLAFVTIVGLTRGWPNPDWPVGVIGALSYVSNWLRIAGLHLRPLEHMWTLAIEEQFYVAWPLVMLLVPRRFLLSVAVVGAAVGLGIYTAFGSNLWTYYATVTNGGALLCGCAVAVARIRFPRGAGQLGVALIVASAITSGYLGVVAGAVLVVGSETPALRPLAPLGLRAYSLYLWSSTMVQFVGPVPGTVAAFAAAEGSFRFVEQPLLRRFHERLAPRQRLRREAVADGRRATADSTPLARSGHRHEHLDDVLSDARSRTV